MHRSCLVLFNIIKSSNFGGLIRTANALGVTEITIVGRRQFSTYGHFGTDDPARRHQFYTMADAALYLKAAGYAIVGVEISPDSIPVESHPFEGDTAFLLGNEGSGLTAQQIQLCDYLVYIRQYGEGSSLNVNVAAGIVLHHFAIWSGYPQNAMEGQKFVPRRNVGPGAPEGSEEAARR